MRLRQRSLREHLQAVWDLPVRPEGCVRDYGVKGGADLLIPAAWILAEFPELGEDPLPPFADYCREKTHRAEKRKVPFRVMSAVAKTLLIGGAFCLLIWLGSAMGGCTIFMLAVLVGLGLVIFGGIRGYRRQFRSVPHSPAGMFYSPNPAFRADFWLLPLSPRELYVAQLAVRLPSRDSWGRRALPVFLLIGQILAVVGWTLVKGLVLKHPLDWHYWPHAILTALIFLASAHLMERVMVGTPLVSTNMLGMEANIRRHRDVEALRKYEQLFLRRRRWYLKLLPPLTWRTVLGRPWQKFRESFVPSLLFLHYLPLVPVAAGSLGCMVWLNAQPLSVAAMIVSGLWFAGLVAIVVSPLPAQFHRLHRYNTKLQLERFEELYPYYLRWLRQQIGSQ